MDCDANDFQSQSQNQQLADEGSTKFSPVLQPFGLSKFDFDDNLQGHPRFDSLVESEVFLGIGNSIDSQWIEDYSRGNGATEFTTCASESCSILRHNNVWSEATSSESVEMLLKSVGLEEAMPRQPAIQPSNSSEPCSTITQMEPNLTDDTGIISDKADTSKGESPSHLDEISPSYTVEKAVKEHQTSEKVVLQTWNGTSSVENLIKEDLSIQSESLGSPMIINIYADGKDVIAHGKSDKSQHLSDLEIREINASASMEIVVTNYDRTENMAVLDHENMVDNVPPSESQNDTKSGPLTITEEACENIEYLEETTACDVQFTADTFVSDHLTEACMEEGNDMRINAALESLDAPPKASLDIQFVDELAEGASVPTTALPKLVENVVLNQDVGVGGLSEGKENRSPYLSRSINDPGNPDQDVGVGSTVAEVPFGFEQPTDSSEQKLLLAADTSADNADELGQDPFPMEVKLPAPSAVAVKPKEEVLRNDVFRDPVGQVNREQVVTEKSTLAVASAEETIGPLEFNQGPASLAGKDGLGGFTNSEVPEKSSESALESSARDNVANAEMDTPSSQLPGSVLPSELPSHHTPEVDHEPCLTCTDVADDAAGESRHVSEMIEAATHSPQIVDTGQEVIDKSGSTAGKVEDIFAILEKPDEVSVEGKSSMDPRNICVSPALPSIDHSNSSKANISSPVVISSMEVSKKEISREQTKKSIDQKPLPDIDMPNMKETEIFKDDQSFSFDVTSLDKRDLTKNWQPFSSASDPKATQGSTIPALLQMENQGLMLNNVGSPPKPVKETSRRRKKDSSEHKPRQASRKGAAKESGKKSSSVKDSAASKQIETVDKLSPHSVTLPGAHQLLPSGELQHHRQIDFTTAKSFGVLTATTSGLSDLNSLAFGHVVFCQPFTDLQQVQLRAQIFVYGSLISKLVPEEVHMMSAFGGPDGGRGMWENAWRVCRERSLGQASLPAILETPVKSRAGEVIFDQVTNHGTRQAAVSSSPAVRSNSKGTASPAINLVQPLGSPVWSFCTQSFDASQLGALPKGAIQPAFSTFHSNQSPPVANFFGPSSSWMSQTPFCSPWSVSPQTSMQEPGTRVPLLPVTESVKPAPVLESPVSVSSSTVGLPSVPAGLLPSASTAVDPKKAAILPGLPSSESKSRKRKKLSTSADPGQISSHQSQIQPSPIPAPVGPHSATYPSIGLHSAIFAPASTSGFLLETHIDKHVPKSPSFLFGDPGLQELDKSKSALSEESIVKVREARKQAEDAAALACTAMNHSQAIWDQLNKHKNSGNVATAEVKLASAAAAISAAASVAKAAAAAASVASKAALQAKLMADEAMNPSRSNCHSSHGDCSGIVGGKDASLSILRGDTATNFSNSTISEARDAVRKKIEAASAASLQAENLGALVKAAELAAEAIAKAGKVVAMGDPLPLTVLAEAGPDGFWELAYPKSSSELHVAKVGDVTVAITDSSRRMAELKHDKGTLGRSMNDTLGLENSGFGKKGGKVSDTGNEGNLLTELQHRPDNTHNDVYGAVETSRQNSIKVGSQVEVFKSGEGFKSAWFSANVLSLKDGKAFVCYSEIPSNEGSGKLEEWVDLECVADEPPKLRIAHPMTVMKFEGKRKRRRAAMGVFTCSVGDKVDAWIKDGWQEGVVTDKDKDGTTVTVHFPEYGDTSVVRAWHLRPSLIWKNGEWVEWTSIVGSLNKCLEGDTPQEKRAKLGTPGLVPGEKDKETKEIQHLVEKEKRPQEGSLKLTSEEKVFNIGKRAADGKKDPARTRTGTRKESSRVVIGVPKPGKKRKFMEVSKHLVGNQTKKTDELKDSAKLASYLIPQVGGPRGWKPFSRGDTKDKGIGDSKMKVLRSGRLQNAPRRTLPPKSNLAAANSSEGPQRDNADHEGFKRNNASEFKPISESEDAASEDHADPVTSSDTGSFKTSMATVRTAWVTKGRMPSGKVAKGEENKALTSDPSKSAADGSEPRRSSRRIQPTSRLLEGLQSSITITKFPSALHDRGHKVSSNGAAKGKNNG